MGEKSSGAIVFHKKNHETKFLILHYTSGHWDFAKGHVEENETEEQALWRELEEETGIKQGQARLVPGFKQRITYFYNRDSQTIFKEVILFLVESKTDSVRLSAEHTGFAWLPFGQALKKTTFDNAKQVLKKAKSFLQQKKFCGNPPA
ncbi:MAG: bis(5'-nucleosyl)-tetraphosphatase [Candidatus ainarchaeum sp.]|nr:bis(5'-nucleosyl)-tetraphosphatase [Candidatus ainarchaeum sp.]